MSGRDANLPDEEDVYGVSEPTWQPSTDEPRSRFVPIEREPMVSEAAPAPPPPRWPMFSGVFTFPWYLQTLTCWMAISVGLIVIFYMLGLMLGPGQRLGLAAARYFIPCITVTVVLTFSYASVCCLKVIEGTSYGLDSIDCAPDVGCKEWVYSYAYMTCQLALAVMAGGSLRLLTFLGEWAPVLPGAFVAFPIILLGSLAADNAWLPLAIWPVLRSLRPLWRQWALFYVETAGLIVAWMLVSFAGLSVSPWLVPLYSAPLFAAVMLIYAGLIGRLASCISEEIESQDDFDDDDEFDDDE